MREVAVHLNVEVPDDDPRSADEIASAVLDNLDYPRFLRGRTRDGMVTIKRFHEGLTVTAPLAEEV